MDGWIKLYRKIEESSFYRDSRIVHLWIHLLIKANKFENKFIWNGEEVILRPGQFITGRKKLSEQTGIEESKIQRALKLFEKCHMIEQQTNSRNRLITVLNWQVHQESEQQMNNKRTASEQPVNTNKEGKKDKNDKKKDIILKPENVTDQTWDDFKKHRSKKKAIITENVIKGFESQAEIAGWTLEQAFKESIDRGWTGFKADWVKNSQQKLSVSDHNQLFFQNLKKEIAENANRREQLEHIPEDDNW